MISPEDALWTTAPLFLFIKDATQISLLSGEKINPFGEAAVFTLNNNFDNDLSKPLSELSFLRVVDVDSDFLVVFVTLTNILLILVVELMLISLLILLRNIKKPPTKNTAIIGQ
jgi:hypothetical protein